MKTLRLENVSKGYGGSDVIRAISFCMAGGESVALLGRNGAGKTTLLHSLFSIGPRCRGEIWLDERRIDGLATHQIARAGLALVPQGRGSFPDLSVEEVLGLATLVRGRRAGPACTLDDIEQRFPRLYERRRTRVSNLSGGERQLLALARALLTRPALIVLDEPSEGLAPMAIRDVLAPELHALRRQGYTVLLAEQNLELALAVATRVILLAEHRIVFDGSAQDFAAHASLQHRYLGL